MRKPVKTGPGRITAFPRRRRRSFGLPRLLIMVGVVLIGYLLLVMGAQSLQQQRVRRELLEYEMRIEEYEARNEAISTEIRRLHDLSYIEILARRYLGLVKPGETVFQVED